MARGVASPAPNALPKVSFVKVSDEVNQKNPGVYDHVARTYGYNDGSEFQRPEHYIRYIEPLESDLAIQVEYDMDEQDQEWLDALNEERKAKHVDKITYETFEIVMDRLEKEWFDLTKNLPKPDMALPSEDSTCAICDDSEGENTNAIVFCDGCNLAVHQDCYGVPYIPEGQWLCRKCTVSPENPVSCILCPNEGGAFKQTVSGDWVHLLCAIWIPETSVANEVFMEPITGVEKISKPRWKLRCSVCDDKYGACIQCTKASCFTAFHATCARKEKFLMPMKATQGSEAPTLACYCEKHLPREQQEVRAAMHRADENDDLDVDTVHPSPKSSKTARAYNKQYKPGPPLVPRIIVNRILQYISKIHVRHKPEFVHLVCKYWSLKREARRGAPLLKRLHLEPWTALSGSKQQTDEEKAMKLDHMKRLRLDLEKLRIVADVVQRRERTKRDQADTLQSVLLQFFFPHEGYLRLAFENITSLDRQEYFKSPVSKAEVPDYYDIIKSPMCWDMIDHKLDRHEYLDLSEFKHDINLVLSNAMTYNLSNTPFYRAALRIRATAQIELAKLDRLMYHPAVSALVPPPLTNADIELVDEKPQVDTATSQPEPDPFDMPLPSIGDLEPPLDILDLLVSEESIRRDTNLIVTTTPIESLLNFELPLIRPPAPPPPPLPPPRRKFQRPQKPKPKYDRKSALERKKQERKIALDSSPGFRAPRTRSAVAAAVAFEAEATAAPLTPEAERQPSTSAAPPSTPAGEKPRRARKSTGSPMQSLPLTVEDVDSRQSFRMFEVGWILPADQKRGGRVPVERQALPPPRKRAKTSHDKSRLSNVSPVALMADGMHGPTGEAQSSSASEAPPSRLSEPPQTQSEGGTAASHALPESMLPLSGDLSRSLPETTPPRESASPQPSGVRESSHAPQTVATALDPAPIAESISGIDTGMDVLKEPIAEPDILAPSAVQEPSAIPEHPATPGPELGPEPASLQEVEPHRTSEPLPAQDEAALVEALVESPSVDSGQPREPSPTQDVSERVAQAGSSLTEAQLTDPIPMDVDEPAVPESEEAVEVVGQPDEEVQPVTSERPQLKPVPESTADAHHEPQLELQPEYPRAVEFETQAEAQMEKHPEPPLKPEVQPEVGSRLEKEEKEEKKDKAQRRIIIIESLDTPAIRREKYLRKKAERLAARERAAAELAAAQRAQGKADGMDIDSDLTDLSDLEDEPLTPAPKPKPKPIAAPEPAPVLAPAPAGRRKAQQPAPDEPGAIILKPGEKVEGGTLVWAKVDSFPWWPAVVFEPDDGEIPKSVLQRAPNVGDSTNVLVRFYEKNHNNNWAWVKVRNLRYLGEDDALDAQMLAPSSKYQRWRNNNRRTECRNAYQDALAEMEAEDEAAMLAGQGNGEIPGSAPSSSRQPPPGTEEADSPMTEVE